MGIMMSHIYDERHILAPLALRGRDELFHLLARTLAELDELDEKAVYEGIYARESMMTTMVAPDIILPHTQFEGLGKSVGILAVLPGGCDYGGGARFKVAVLLVDDSLHVAEHLEALRNFALVAKNPRFLEKVCLASTPAQARSVLERMELTS